MTDNDLPDVMEVVPQEEISISEENIVQPEVETTDLYIEEKLVDTWAQPKSKAVSTLSEYQKEDAETQTVMMSNYVYSTLRTLAMNNAFHVRLDEYQHPLVSEGKPILTECPDGRIDLDMCTRMFATKIATRLSSIDVLLDKIQKRRQSFVPELPQSVINIIQNAFRMPSDDKWIIPEGYRRSLAYVMMSIVYRQKSPATDVFMAIYKDVAGGLQSAIIRGHLTKDILPSNAKVAIQKEVYTIMEQITAENVEERIRCLGV